MTTLEVEVEKRMRHWREIREAMEKSMEDKLFQDAIEESIETAKREEELRMEEAMAEFARHLEEERRKERSVIESDESSRLIEEAERLITQAIVVQGELLIEQAKHYQKLHQH